MANLVIPVASFTEYSGSIISCDNILQTFNRAITKNDTLVDICEVASLFGGPLKTDRDRYDELKKIVVSLNDFDPDTIPATGLKLT